MNTTYGLKAKCSYENGYVHIARAYAPRRRGLTTRFGRSCFGTVGMRPVYSGKRFDAWLTGLECECEDMN